MKITKNLFGHFVVKTDSGKCLTNGDIYTPMLITVDSESITDWAEIDEADMPAQEEEITDKEAFSIILGGDSV